MNVRSRVRSLLLSLGIYIINYPRFGFLPASTFGLSCIWPVPEGVFMAIELVSGSLDSSKGLVKYEPEFNDV